MTAASVADLNQPDMQVGFDAALRKRLQERYGAATEIVVVVDGGADFERFRRERIAGRSAGPRRQVEQRRMELGDAPSQ
jgi:hypothetical protein